MNDITKPKDIAVIEKAFLAEKLIKAVENSNGLELAHHFSDGVYARELAAPADTIIVGKLHKYQNLNILVSGVMSVLIDGEIKTIRGPLIVTSPAGTKRVAYTHTDCTWITILRTDEVDPDKIEEIFTSKSLEEYISFCTEQMKLPLFEDTQCLPSNT